LFSWCNCWVRSRGFPSKRWVVLSQTARAAIFINLYAILLANISAGGETIDPKKVQVTIIEPKKGVEVEPKDKVKIRIELKQPDGYQRPDSMIITLGDGTNAYSTYVASKMENNINRYEIEVPVPVVKGKNNFEVYAEAVYTVPSNSEKKKRAVTRVKTEPLRIKIK
jgi:hypothetical protein